MASTRCPQPVTGQPCRCGGALIIGQIVQGKVTSTREFVVRTLPVLRCTTCDLYEQGAYTPSGMTAMFAVDLERDDGQTQEQGPPTSAG